MNPRASIRASSQHHHRQSRKEGRKEVSKEDSCGGLVRRWGGIDRLRVCRLSVIKNPPPHVLRPSPCLRCLPAMAVPPPPPSPPLLFPTLPYGRLHRFVLSSALPCGDSLHLRGEGILGGMSVVGCGSRWNPKLGKVRKMVSSAHQGPCRFGIFCHMGVMGMGMG